MSWGWLIVAVAAAIAISLAASGTIAFLLRVLPEGRARLSKATVMAIGEGANDTLITVIARQPERDDHS